MSHLGVSVALLSALASTDASAAVCGGAVVCACGDTVTSDYTLPGNLVCAPARSVGLVIGADNVTLDGGGFGITMQRNSSVGVSVTAFADVTITNLTVARAAGFTNVVGIALQDADRATITFNTLAGMGQGIRVTGPVSSDLVIEDNDVSGNLNGTTNAEGMTLRSVGGTLSLLRNDFSNSKRGLTLRSLVGPWTLDPSNTFLNVGRAETDTVIRLETTTDVTVDGIDASAALTSGAYHQGVGVFLAGTTGTVITNCDLSGHDRGVQTQAFGTSINTDGTIVGNDVTDADVWGMELRAWDESLVLSSNTFDLSDNGLRLVDIDPAVGTSLDLDFATSSFANVGESVQQAGVKIVDSHDVTVTNLTAVLVGRGTGFKIENSDHVDVDNLLVCGTTRVGIDLGIDTLNPPGVGADDVVFGSPGAVYVEDADLAGVRTSVESDRNVLDVMVGGTGVSLVDNAGPGETTGTVTKAVTPGWAFDDLDGDTCNDLCPGDGHDDADADGYCDRGDFSLGSTTLFDGTDIPWNPTGGAGSPSVVYDAVAGQFVMIYETRTAAPDATCLNGRWSLGLATSPDGVTFTDVGGPLLSPTAGTPYACVAAHPSIVQNGATTVVFFKAEKEAVAGVARYAGVGRLVLSWDPLSSSYAVAVDPSVVITQQKAFGYVRALYDATAGVYRVALSRSPSPTSVARMAVTAGPAAGPFPALTNVLAAGAVGWGPDEIFNPAVTCGVSQDGFSLFLGGRLLNGAVIDGQGLGRLTSADFSTWATGSAGSIVDTANGDPEFRHWDVLPLGEGDFVVFYDDLGGPGGTNRIRVGVSSDRVWNAATAAAVGDKVCTP